MNVAQTTDKLTTYQRGEGPLPAQSWLWPLYGAGLENLGRDGKPIAERLPRILPDELLVRHDAVGLCFSDTKIVKTGETHPRLTGRDMHNNPVVMGHEVALTIVQVGEQLKDKFAVGERFIMQSDIYFKGIGLAYGYALQGGLSQYNVIGEEVLEGDEGCYLLPVQPKTGYAEAALTEPWACVVASYDVPYHSQWKPGGNVLIVGPFGPTNFKLGDVYAEGQPPAHVWTTGVASPLITELRERMDRDKFLLTEIYTGPDDASKRLMRGTEGQGFDDIVLINPDAAMFERFEPLARKGATISIVGIEKLTGPTQVDVGRLHYDQLYLVGTDTNELGAAYKPVRTQLRAGGRAVFVGAAGPMGQMHVQRALQAQDGPRQLVATDLAPDRLAVLDRKFSQFIEAKRSSMEVVLRTPEGKSGAAFNADLLAMTGGEGFDDVVILAPSANVVAGAVMLLAPDGVMNIFAGLPKGTKAPIDLRLVAQKRIRFTGSSGSMIRDLRNMLNAAEAGNLDPNLSVAAVSGLNDAKKGIEGVMNQTYPGKIVVYPQILDFPLTALAELRTVLPKVYALLGPNESWTVAAEAEFLKELLP
jgi:threonine dehydrogenase-like Zn-dependent dehydrogenase